MIRRASRFFPRRAAAGPVFLFTMHRSGGTLVMRLLNCHPKLVIWGEHGGVLNQLLAMDEIVALHDPLNPLADSWWRLAKFVRNKGKLTTLFAPWAGPLTSRRFRTEARNFVQRLFTRGLRRGQRWGFKEIRYYRPEMAAFLLDLFPDARFVLLQRDLAALAVSNILAPWSIAFINKRQPDLDAATAIDIIEDVAYGLIAFTQSFAAIAAAFPDRSINVDYRSWDADGMAEITRIAEFLQLDITPRVVADWRATLASRLGETDKAAACGVLDRDLIERHLATALPRLRQQFADEGTAPLLARFSQRQRPYAAILGDHTAADGGPTTIF